MRPEEGGVLLPPTVLFGMPLSILFGHILSITGRYKIIHIVATGLYLSHCRTLNWKKSSGSLVTLHGRSVSHAGVTESVIGMICD